MKNLVIILSNIVSGYPYFSLVYILIFLRKIKPDEFYSSLILASNILFSSLSILIILHYFIEIFTAWYSGNLYESYAFASRAYGILNYQFYFGLILFALFLPLIFWFKYFRKSILATILVSLFILSFMWLESIVSIIISFNKDYLPSKWIYDEPWYVRYIFTPVLQAISYSCVLFFFVKVKTKFKR